MRKAHLTVLMTILLLQQAPSEEHDDIKVDHEEDALTDKKEREELSQANTNVCDASQENIEVINRITR